MKSYREIEFTTTRIKGDLTAGKTCYQGHLRHNAVPSEKETRRRFADCCNQEPFETNKYIDASARSSPGRSPTATGLENWH